MRSLIVAAFGGESSTMFTKSQKRRSHQASNIMLITVVGASSLVLGTRVSLAQEACVVCAGPDAIYRCTVEKADKLARFGGAGDKALQHVCSKEMARQGKHDKCSVRRESAGAACDGLPRMITLASLLEAEAEPPPPASPSAAPVAGPPRPAKVEPEKTVDTKSQPPRTVQELAERTGETSKQQLKDTGDSIGYTAQRTWKCLATLFQKC